MRLILPEVRQIKYALVWGVLLNIFACFIGGAGNIFAIQKTLGFFIYFMAGYFISSDMLHKLSSVLSKKIAIICLLLEGVAIVYVAKFIDYKLWLSVLSRSATIYDFDKWYFCALAYFVVLIITIITCGLVINVVPTRCSFLEKQGEDTMPMYMSHLVVFLILGYVVNKSNWIIATSISLGAIIFCVLVFSTSLYRKCFDTTFKYINSLIFRKSSEG